MDCAVCVLGISLCEKKTTTATEKKTLHQAGLGCKKIKLLVDDSEEAVLDKLTSDAKDEYGSTVGFPQLRTCGGFEMLQCLANCRDLSVIGSSWSVQDLKSALGGQATIYLRPIQKSLSTRSIEPKSSGSLLKEKCRWCQRAFLFSELRELSSKCTGNVFDDSDDDATDVSAVMNGGPNSSNSSTQSSLNIPISIAAQQPVNVRTTCSQQSSQSVPSQQHPLQEDSMVAATQAANHTTLQSIQATNQPLGIDNNATTSTTNLADVVQEVVIKCAESGNPVQILQCLQESVVVGRALDIVNVSDSLGDVNFILVNRYNLLETAFDEIQLIENPRLTLQVQFYGEVSFLNLLNFCQFTVTLSQVLITC